MKGLIIKNVYQDFEESNYQPKRLKEEFEKLGVETDILKNDGLGFTLENGKIKSSLEKYDFCVYFDKDKYTLKMLEKSGYKLFNGYNQIEVCDDKMLTLIETADNNIKMPTTIAGLMVYDKKQEIPTSYYESIEKKLGYPFIFKLSYGSLGKGVFLIKNRREFVKTYKKYKTLPHLFQKFVPTSYGKDIRIIVIGGKVVGAIQRNANHGFRSNLSIGGRGEQIKIPKSLEDTAVKITKILNLDYAGLDFLIGDNEYLLCEVNSNAFFKGFEKTTNINVAKIYAEFILNKIRKN